MLQIVVHEMCRGKPGKKITEKKKYGKQDKFGLQNTVFKENNSCKRDDGGQRGEDSCGKAAFRDIENAGCSE